MICRHISEGSYVHFTVRFMRLQKSDDHKVLRTQLLLHSSQFSVLLADGPDFNCQVHCDWHCWRREIHCDGDSECSYEVAVNVGQYPTLLAIFHLLFFWQVRHSEAFFFKFNILVNV